MAHESVSTELFLAGPAIIFPAGRSTNDREEAALLATVALHLLAMPCALPELGHLLTLDHFEKELMWNQAAIHAIDRLFGAFK